jgi:hypothetical protein
MILVGSSGHLAEFECENIRGVGELLQTAE